MDPATLIKNDYSVDRFVAERGIHHGTLRVLNAGSSSTRYGNNCLNLDIQDKPEVDIIADLHNLPADIGTFDVVICNGVLQYCEQPAVVIEQLYSVLNPEGVIFLDAPWIQPYCEDTDDLYRFSQKSLLRLMQRFEVVDTGPSITAGSATAMVASSLFCDLSQNKYLRYALKSATEVICYPLRWLKTSYPERAAGAFYVVGRKPLAKQP